jgi:hypothetical protein
MIMPRVLSLALLVPALVGPTKPGRTTFTIRIENVSSATTLRLSSGQTAPAPTAPVLWVVHRGHAPIFTEGKRDRGVGLERLAEDGDPGILAKSLAHAPGVVGAGAIDHPQGDSSPGPITPGKAYQFTVTAAPGEALSLAFMFGQSNDLFYAAQGLRLFDASGRPATGDFTAKLALYDAGTEVNQEPGAGPDQAPRQTAPNTGAAERGSVRPIGAVRDGFTYPSVGQVVRLSLSPVEQTASTR